MASIDIKTIEKLHKERNTIHEKVYATYSTFDNYGEHYVQSDTYDRISIIQLDRTLFKNELMENHYGQLEASIITSRGCVFDCAFCGGARSLNTEIYPRMKNQQCIESEIADLLTLYPELQSVRVLDDLFLRSKDSIQIAIDVFSKYQGLTWRGMAHILSIKNAIEFLNDLKKSGCRELFVGIESGSPDIRNKINKQGSCEDVLFVAEKY